MAMFLTSLFIVLMFVLAVKMTVEQHQAIYNVVTTLAVIAMVLVVAVYFGICLVRCIDICSDYLATGVVGAMAVPARLSRAISECTYGLSETSHGWMPKSRRVYKARLSKVRRQLDAIEIAEGLADVVPAETDFDWAQFDEDYALSLCTIEDEVNEMWEEWSNEQSEILKTMVDARLTEMLALNKQAECDTLWHNYEQGGC